MKNYRFRNISTGTSRTRGVAAARQNPVFGLFVPLIALLLLSGCTSETSPDESSPAAADEVAVAGNETFATQNGAGASSNQSVSGYTTVSGGSIAARPSALSSMPDGVTVTDFIVVSTSRSGRTLMDFVLRLKVSNASSTHYQKVVASLLGAPAHIVIVDGLVAVGDLPPNSTILSQDTFTLRVNLAISTSFDDFVWQIDGDVKPPPPPPTGAPSRKGIFMNVDDLSIPGE